MPTKLPLAVGLTLIAGVAGGVAATLAWKSMPIVPTTALSGKSSSELGAALLRRVGRDLIADDRNGRWVDGPINFYTVPKPFGETLCRVGVYTVAPKVVRGKALTDQEVWDDELKIETRYGLWKLPSAAGGDRDRACAAYRDFEHLISDGSILSAARATYVMDSILKQARTGKFGFKVTCVEVTGEPDQKPIACDPIKMLRTMSLKGIYRTEMKSEMERPHSSLRRDEIYIDGSKIGKDLSVTITVNDEQHFGKQSMDEADVVSVSIQIDHMC